MCLLVIARPYRPPPGSASGHRLPYHALICTERPLTRMESRPVRRSARVDRNNKYSKVRTVSQEYELSQAMEYPQ